MDTKEAATSQALARAIDFGVAGKQGEYMMFRVYIFFLKIIK